MLNVLTMTSEKTTAMFLTLLTVAAMLAAQLSVNGCMLSTFEQPKLPASLIKED